MAEVAALPAGTEIRETPLRLIAHVYDHEGQSLGAIAERERDKAFGLVTRIGPGGTVFDPAGSFLTIEQMQKLALQVVAGNPKAAGHAQTPHALAVGFLAVLAAVQAGSSQGGVDVQAP